MSEKNKLIPANTKINPCFSTMFLIKNYITKPNITIGDYTYYHDFKGETAALAFENNNILYHFPEMLDDQLIIGKFCSIAQGVLFIMNGGNHNYQAISTFPFPLLNETTSLSIATALDSEYKVPIKSPTTIGHDVWIGHDVTILRGVTIGNGSCIAAKSVVTKDVAPYAIVGGNPAQFIKYRFDSQIIAKLQQSQWWNWPISTIEKNLLSFKIKPNNQILEQFLKIKTAQ